MENYAYADEVQRQADAAYRQHKREIEAKDTEIARLKTEGEAQTCKLQAIRSLINGDFDDPSLRRFGPLFGNQDEDICHILDSQPAQSR